MAGRKTDRQTSGKTTHWSITVWEEQWSLMEVMPPGIKWWGWQKEISPTTGKFHYQGACISADQHRWSGCKGDYKVASTLRAILPGVHFEPADDWVKLLQYCKKQDTRAPGSEFMEKTNENVVYIPDHFTYAETLGKLYYETYGVDDFDDCVWDKKHTNDKTNLISVSDRMDILIDRDIEEGKRYASWISANPMWTAMWRKRWRSYIKSFKIKPSSINAS